MENWLLYLDRTHQAARWPFPDRAWEELTAQDLERMPGFADDFTRYSPSDGPTEMTHVPTEMPHEVPWCSTRFGAYHDDKHFHVVLHALEPDRLIPELADLEQEDISLAIQLDGPERGLYFGLNEKGEHIGCVQVWDKDLQPRCEPDRFPWTLLKQNPGAGPSESQGGILRKEYAARVLKTQAGLTACFRIEMELIASGIRDRRLRMTVGRRCYRTCELVAWAGTTFWEPRTDRMGTILLGDENENPVAPSLKRVDIDYDPARESGDLRVSWRGLTPDSFAGFKNGYFADFAEKATMALNGEERTMPLDGEMTARFNIADGWNRLEVMSVFGPPTVVSFQKCSGNRIVRNPLVKESDLPAADAVQDAFEAWHAAHEKQRQAPGVWGSPAARMPCLCHNGVFHADPYLTMCESGGSRDIYLERIRETCERMLAEQRPEGWYPCYCFTPDLRRTPEVGEGGAFTNGSVGEAMFRAGILLKEPRYEESACRAAAYDWYRFELNENYMAFALWHLAALYEHEPRQETLNKALYFAKNFVTRDIGICGSQDGHNLYTDYGNITLRGLSRLLEVLPPEHDYRPKLKEKVLRFANQMLTRQQPDGAFAGRNRKYLGYRNLCAGLFFTARAAPETKSDLAPALAAMYYAAVAGNDPDAGLVIACMARFLTR